MSRGDSPMNCRWAWMLPVLSIATMLINGASAQGQGPGPGGPPPGMMGPGMMGPSPGMYDPDAMGGMGMAGPDGMGGYGEGDCGPGGPGCNGLLGDILGIALPYADGGCAAPRWYDFEVGVITLTRDNTGRTVNFASANQNGAIVLSTDDLNFHESTSFKFSAMMQWGPGSNLEFTYYGLFGWKSQAQVTGLDNLFSAYSNFGDNPSGGFVETDEASLAAISYFSTFNNYEINYRQRWQSPNCRYQGSWLYGVRYFQLDEDFNYRIDNTLNDAVVGTNVNTNNALTGLQIGGDVWVCLIPGLRIGGEGKFAVLGNHSNIDSRIAVTSGGVTTRFNESLTVGDVAFLGDLAAYATYRVNYNWTLKAGYQVLYLDGASLAAENFNRVPPAFFTQNAIGPAPTRVPTARENGDVLWHGFTVSAEYLW